MRGEEVDAAAFDRKLAAAADNANLLPAGPADPLNELKAKMAADKAAKQKALAPGDATEPAKPDPKAAK
jgi:hypothetical protein